MLFRSGKVQQLLTHYNKPYTGSRSLASALSMNKEHAKHSLRGTEILMPDHFVIEDSPDIEQKMREAYNSFAPKCVVKPISAGSSVGVSIAENYQGFTDAVHRALATSLQALVEEYIEGREATCGVVQGMRGERI